MLPAIFLDKDGTLIHDVPYNVDPAQMRLCAGVATGIQWLHEAGFVLVVVTNQSGVARGYFDEAAIAPVEHRLRQLLDVPLGGFYYCPHHPDGIVPNYAKPCNCRKPAPGMLLQAAADLDLDLSQSWLVGDILNDIAAGQQAGCRTVLINNGNETEWVLSPGRIPHATVSRFDQAADFILHQSYAYPRHSNATFTESNQSLPSSTGFGYR
ncbi:HAD family hydrolase [Oscillatoria sp. CS-180]|uniref:D-glycero-alpha-D-manno-heptose-1,7-bisphosphate 7-phosphatase n=1 Tax=Oscillatoria sp. CS-180 TaxID=3021720 RepID=UPI00232FF5AB|nr:HAD family hydrolase [Oscillatoria sp. CS-180]MDB9526500.1 HAD family hydrolase [Oscillatoria sp. CS-180]